MFDIVNANVIENKVYPKTKSLIEMDQPNTEQSDNQTNQDKGIIKGRADFQVSESVSDEQVPGESTTDTHIQIENEEIHIDIVHPGTIKINDVAKYKIDIQ